jgi:hypothetical protein
MEVIETIDKQAQRDLVERIKELSCLYGIAQLAADTNMDVDMVLDGIVRILPAAWLYPEVACARIILDDHSHPEGDYKPVRHRLRAPIIVVANIVAMWR